MRASSSSTPASRTEHPASCWTWRGLAPLVGKPAHRSTPVSGTPTATFSSVMAEQILRRYARRVAKGAWWLATPWRMGARLEFLRQRAEAQARATEFALLVDAERMRLASRERGIPIPAVEPLDLFDDAAVCNAAGLPLDSILWPPVAPQDITDRWTAARFMIDLWRKRGDLRTRYPL